jgi:putative heme transporter
MDDQREDGTAAVGAPSRDDRPGPDGERPSSEASQPLEASEASQPFEASEASEASESCEEREQSGASVEVSEAAPTADETVDRELATAPADQSPRPAPDPHFAGDQPVEARPRGSDDDPIAVRRADLRVPSWLDTLAQYAWRSIVLVAAAALIVVAMSRLYLATLPLILALVLSTLFVPPARRLERRGFPRLAAAGVVVIGGFTLFVGLVTLLAPAFVTQAQELGPTIVDATEQVLTWLEEGPIGYDRARLEELLVTTVSNLEGFATTVASQIGSIAVAVAEALTALSLAFVLLFFFVKDGAQIVAWFQRLTPTQHLDDLRATGTRGWVALSGFVRGTAAVALIDAVGIGIGLAIVGVPLVLPLSVLVFFGGFVPVVGAFVTGILAILVALATTGFTAALIVTGIVILVQQVESNVLQPTIMKRAVSLHPIVTLTVLVVGAMLVGIIGAFLAVPITAVLAAVGNELRLRRDARRLGIEVGPLPLGGPGVHPETTLPDFPPETRPRRRRRGGGLPPADEDARRSLRRRRRRERADVAPSADGQQDPTMNDATHRRTDADEPPTDRD